MTATLVLRVPERQAPAPDHRHRGRGWRDQVVELLPLAVRVTEYQMAVRRAAADRPGGLNAYHC
jgi:hypothetical protein